jgi:hypothetical protein
VSVVHRAGGGHNPAGRAGASNQRSPHANRIAKREYVRALDEGVHDDKAAVARQTVASTSARAHIRLTCINQN